MRESILRDHLYEHPELLFDEPPTSRHKEFRIEGKFVDLLFEVDDVFYIVELKRDTITREAVGQVLEYYGRLRNAHPSRKYRMMLVAPSIPVYRSLPLEEFGIRCVELSFPASEQELVYDDLTLSSVVRPSLLKTSLAEITADHIQEAARFEQFLPPTTRAGFDIAQQLFQVSIPMVQTIFSDYEVRPVRMGSMRPMDILCLSESAQPIRAGIWWAFAFGVSEEVPKNDSPNISVNAYPWGLDFAINAELRTSQRVLIRHIVDSVDEFNALVRAHGTLELQFWRKLEHQPRGYHWTPIRRFPVGSWHGQSLLQTEQELREEYLSERDRHIAELIAGRPELSEGQRNHLLRMNKTANIAIRLVHTLPPEDTFWERDYGEQLKRLGAIYQAMKPLIEFFN